MSKRTRIALWLAIFILGFLLAIPQSQASIPSQPFKVWHDREYLGQLEMQKNVYMDAGLFLQGALINGATGGDPVVVGDHMRVDGILYANNIIVRGASGGDPVIIGDHLRVDGDIFNPYNSVRVKDDFKVSGSSQFSGDLKAKKGVVVTGGNLTVGNSTKFKVECKTGETTISGPLTVTSTSSLKDLTVSGSSSLASLSTSGLATLDSLSVTRSSTFNNSVNVQGNATFTRKVTLGDTAGDTITIIGTPTFSNPISGNVNMTGSLVVGGNVNVSGTLTCGTITYTNLDVTGATRLLGAMQFGDAPGDGIDIQGIPTFRTHFTVWDDGSPTVFQGDVNINGLLTTGAINIAGTNADTFTVDADGSGGDVTLVFGAANAESLMWNDAPAAQYFEFSNDVYIGGKLTVTGAIDPTSITLIPGSGGADVVIVRDTTNANNVFVVDEDGDLTLGDGGAANFVVAGATGNTTTQGTLTVVSTSDLQGNVDAGTGLDVTGANLTVGTFTVVPGTGTVSAGIWQGTPIADAYIPNNITIDYAADAGTLDTIDSLSFLRSDATDQYTSGTLTLNAGTTLNIVGAWQIGGTAVNATATELNLLSGLTGTIWTSNNDGAGSGLDADLLDGNDSTAFMGAGVDNWVDTTGDTMTGALTVNNSVTLGDGSDIITIGTATDDVAITDANWSITGAGVATLASIDASSGGITNAGAISGATTITASGLIQSTAGNIQGVSGVFSTDVQTPLYTANLANVGTSNITINAEAGTAGTVDIGTGTATGLITIGNNGVNTVTVAPALTVSNGMAVTTGGLTVSAGGASISGGLNNNAGGITSAGAIGGISSLGSTASVIFDLNNAANTTLTVTNAGVGAASLTVDDVITGGSFAFDNSTLDAEQWTTTSGDIVLSPTTDNVEIDRGGTSYPIATVEDSASTDKQLIQYGTCNDGVIDYTDDNFRDYNAGCTPILTLTPITDVDVADEGYTVHIKTSTNTGFAYEVRETDSGVVTDVTATVPVHWHAMGWE